jgi:hypothetical protein
MLWLGLFTGIPFFETSAENNIGVAEAFTSLITDVYRAHPAEGAARPDSIRVDRATKKPSIFSKCCGS